MASNQLDYSLIEKNEMENFMERCMLAAGCREAHAKSLAACLIAGDYRGHFSHGLNRLGKKTYFFFKLFFSVIILFLLRYVRERC